MGAVDTVRRYLSAAAEEPDVDTAAAGSSADAEVVSSEDYVRMSEDLYSPYSDSASGYPGSDGPVSGKDASGKDASSGSLPGGKVSASGGSLNVLAGRARRLVAMSLLLLMASVGTVFAFSATWYQVTIPAGTVVMGADGAAVSIPEITVAVDAFTAVAEGSSSPFCPVVPHAAGFPVAAVAVVIAGVLGVVASLLRSPLLAFLSLFSSVQGFRHLGILHAAVAEGPAGCLIGDLSVGFGRSAAVFGMSAIIVLTALIAFQIWKVRSAERSAKIAAGESVPPTLVELVQSRVVGIAGAVVAESQRR